MEKKVILLILLIILLFVMFAGADVTIQSEEGANADDNEEQDFWINPEEKVRCQMMSQKARFGYCENEALRILEMPYINRDLSMVVFLPRKKDGLPDLESIFDIKTLDDCISNIKPQYVKVFFQNSR